MFRKSLVLVGVLWAVLATDTIGSGSSAAVSHNSQSQDVTPRLAVGVSAWLVAHDGAPVPPVPPQTPDSSGAASAIVIADGAPVPSAPHNQMHTA